MLRDEILEIIDANGGIETITKNLKVVKDRSPYIEKQVYRKIITYLDAVYHFDKNEEERSIEHRKLTLWVIDFLKRKEQHDYQNAQKAVIEIFTLKKNYAEKLRRLG